MPPSGIVEASTVATALVVVTLRPMETERERRMRLAVERETLAERRARLSRDVELFDLPQWEPQRVKLRAAIAELPPVGGPADALT